MQALPNLLQFFPHTQAVVESLATMPSLAGAPYSSRRLTRRSITKEFDVELTDTFVMCIRHSDRGSSRQPYTPAARSESTFIVTGWPSRSPSFSQNDRYGSHPTNPRSLSR